MTKYENTIKYAYSMYISYVNKLIKETFDSQVLCNVSDKIRLGVFENRVLRRIFGLKRDEVTVECRKIA
jgi:hypothetical protein